MPSVIRFVQAVKCRTVEINGKLRAVYGNNLIVREKKQWCLMFKNYSISVQIFMSRVILNVLTVLTDELIHKKSI